ASAPIASASAPRTDASKPAAESPPEHATASETPKTVSQVRIRDRDVFAVRVPLMGQTAAVRAAAASRALEHVVEEREAPEVRTEQRGEVSVVFAGPTPIIQLGPEDAEAAGDSSVAVHAASVSEKIRDAVKSERNRKLIAQSVFSFSLLIFSGLIAV